MTPLPRRATMRALAAVLLLALILAGCATPAPTGDHSALAADRGAAPSSITLTVNGTEPTYLKVAIRNNLDRDLTVTNQAFRLVDASGTVVPIYQIGMGSMSQLVFPTYATLGPHETAKGLMSFFGMDSVAPYVLHYDYDGVSATAQVAQPAAPSVENVSPPTDAHANMTNDTPAEPASVGEWINGTEFDARLASVGIDNKTATATFDIVYKNATPVNVRIIDVIRGTHVDFSDGRTTATMTFPVYPARLNLQPGTADPTKYEWLWAPPDA